MLLSLAIWLQNTALFRFLRESDHGYEILLALHVSSIALFAATVVMTDLRLLGWAWRGHSAQSIINEMRVPKRVGFLCVATFGFLMFGMKAEEYYYNAFFRTKVVLFLLVAAHAIIFRPRVYNRATAPSGMKLAAGCSLALWLAIVCAGRGIGYIHPPVFSHHFALQTRYTTEMGLK
jgi:hypothetical protein